jgi:hypothetical protein
MKALYTFPRLVGIVGGVRRHRVASLVPRQIIPDGRHVRVHA